MKRNYWPRLYQFLLKFVAILFVGSILLVLLFRVVPVYLTPLMVLRSLEQIGGDKPVTLKHQWLPLESISKNMALAVICSEDQNFFNHYGIDFKAIQSALKDSKQGTGRLRGASTISQQTAKNVFLWPSRSWLRKGLELYFTLLIETLWPKERILEVYLNSIEMGRGVYGAEAAAHYYFKKTAGDLSRREAAAIAAALPNPREYPVNPPSSFMQSRISWILKQMRLFGPLKLNSELKSEVK